MSTTLPRSRSTSRNRNGQQLPCMKCKNFGHRSNQCRIYLKYCSTFCHWCNGAHHSIQCKAKQTSVNMIEVDFDNDGYEQVDLEEEGDEVEEEYPE